MLQSEATTFIFQVTFFVLFMRQNNGIMSYKQDSFFASFKLL